MKKMFTLLALVVAVVMTSCEEYDGRWKPIEVDKSQLSFTPEGGEQTITVLNYNRWWISGGYEDYDKAKNEYTNYVYPTSTDGEDICTYDLLDGGWYYVTVPEKGASNTVIIAVDKNETGKARKATVLMTVGNASTQIEINQQ